MTITETGIIDNGLGPNDAPQVNRVIQGEEFDLKPGAPLTGDLDADQILAAHLAGNPAPADPNESVQASLGGRVAVLEQKLADFEARLLTAFGDKV